MTVSTDITIANDQIGTDNTILPKVPRDVPDVTLTELQRLVKAAGSNPATLEFPTDKWGFTSAIKQAVLKAASTVNGQDDKHALIVGTMAVLIAHIKARKESDAALQTERRARNQAFADERGPRERVTGRPVDNTVLVIPDENTVIMPTN